MPETKEVEILLVEDNPNDAELIQRTLHKLNITNEIVWVQDGAEAIDCIFNTGKYTSQKGTKPRLILLDLRLPKIDGLEVLKKLKNDPNTRHIPVIVLTSSNEDKDMVASYNLGVNSFVSKPVEFEEFVKVVSNLGLYWLIVNKMPRSR